MTRRKAIAWIGKNCSFAYSILLASLLVAVGGSPLYSPVRGTSAILQPPPSNRSSGGVDIWYLHPQNYRYAGLNVENPHDRLQIIVGVQLTYNLSSGSDYRAKMVIRRGELDENSVSGVEAYIDGFRTGCDVTQNFLFSDEKFLCVNSDFNLQFRPMRAERLTFQFAADGKGSSFYRDPATGEWSQHGDSPSSPDIRDRTWKMGALVEPVSPLVEGSSISGSMMVPDAVDAFHVDLLAGKSYIFSLEGSTEQNFELQVHRDRGPGGTVGVLDEDTLLASAAETEAYNKIVVTTDYTGRYYILVKPRTGSGVYELGFQENRPPIAVAGDDMTAKLELGGTVSVEFKDMLSYDPDDDLDGNCIIDTGETDNLIYGWDFDSSVDSDLDGDPGNDQNAVGKSVRYSFSEGGWYAVTLTVEDSYGAVDSATRELFVNYVPVVDFSVSASGNGNAYVGERLLFDAEGTYDPDDDIDKNGVIDGAEIDRLTYEWDFFDGTDNDRDGNGTNDTDASSRAWLIKFEEEGIYRVTLNVRDGVESGISAYNFTRKNIWIYDQYDPSGLFHTGYTVDGMLSYEDAAVDPRTGQKTEDDVAIRTRRPEWDDVLVVGSKPDVNIFECYARCENESMILGIESQGPMDIHGDRSYHLYIVGGSYGEPVLNPSNLDHLAIDGIYSFTVEKGTLTAVSNVGETYKKGGPDSTSLSPGGGVAMEGVSFTLEDEERRLEIRVPLRELTGLRAMVENDKYFMIDVFAVAEMNSSTIIRGERIFIYARDSAGRDPSDYPGDWWGVSVEPDIEQQEKKNGPTIPSPAWIISLSVILPLIILIAFIAMRRKRKSEKVPGEYIIARHDVNITGFTVGNEKFSADRATWPTNALQYGGPHRTNGRHPSWRSTKVICGHGGDNERPVSTMRKDGTYLRS